MPFGASIIVPTCSTILASGSLPRLGVCLDLAVVNGKLHGYEIKSDRDKLDRLQSQVAGYSRVVDYASLVAGYRHFELARAAVPEWWELLEVTADGELRRRRAPRLNPARSPEAIAQLLWQRDALRLLARRGGLQGLRSAPRELLWQSVCERYELEEIAAAARIALSAKPTRLAALRRA